MIFCESYIKARNKIKTVTPMTFCVIECGSKGSRNFFLWPGHKGLTPHPSPLELSAHIYCGFFRASK